MRIKHLAVPVFAGLLIALGTGPAIAQDLEKTVAAAIPTGTFVYAATTFASSPLWDVTGTYTFDYVEGTDSDDSTVVITNSSATGVLTGTRTDTIIATVQGTPLNLTASSKVTGQLTVTHSGATIGVFSSSGTVSGSGVVGTIKGQGVAAIIASNLTVAVVGSQTVSGHIGHHSGTVKVSGTATNSLPAGMTGEWSLTVISTNVDKVEGTGIITLSNRRALTNALSGSYDSAKGTASLKLTGEGDAKGASLLLTTTNGAALDLDTLSGKVLGQTPKYP